MGEGDSDRRPIQVLLETKRFIELEEPQEFRGGSKDFFKDEDPAFAQHKARVKALVSGAADAIRRSKQPTGFVKVRQRQQALAKSHRPLASLFSQAHQFSLVGTERSGELLFQATPAALDRLAHIIEEKAELTPKLVRNEEKGTVERRVTGYRSELGGIDEVLLHGPSDRVRFSASEAVEWMSHPEVIGGYLVELFKPSRQANAAGVDRLIASFSDGLKSLSGGLLVRPFLPSVQTRQFGEPSLAVSIHLLKGERRFIELPFLPDGRALEMSEASIPREMRGFEADLAPDRHAALLSFLSEQALVRSVELPPALETTPALGGHVVGPATVPKPNEGIDYPVVAVVDGGVSRQANLGAWIVGDAGLVPEGDRDENHGTFIAGLLASGSALNPSINSSIEPAGCRIFDLDLFPRRELRGQYYPDIEDLFDSLDEKVRLAKSVFGVRIFNLSFKIGQRSSRLAYSLAADRLDRIARANDVIFVVAAGNLQPGDCRPPWPSNSEKAAQMLAAFGAGDQQITAPAEHVLGVTVGAVNTGGFSAHAPLLPTTYTRRGPGVGGARKPELSHFGGVSASDSLQTGLISLSPIGFAVHDCGTSFAAPLVAATLATLDQRLNRQAPRETLLALPVHRAVRATSLDQKPVRHAAREFVGFGMSPAADSVLEDGPSAVSLVFTERLLAKQRLEFTFSWPQSLVGTSGACRGRADVTLCYTPPVDPDHREEAIRVQLEAHLHQESVDQGTGEITWVSRLAHDAADVPGGINKSEIDLIRTGLKWSPLKRYSLAMPNGRGASSNWRLSLDSLVRGGEVYPADGVSFTLVMTLSSLDGTTPIREEVRRTLQSRGIVLADISVAHRLRTRSTT